MFFGVEKTGSSFGLECVEAVDEALGLLGFNIQVPNS